MPDNLNIIRNFIRFLAFLLFFSSCNGEKQGVFDEMPPLHSAPLTVTLNTEEGYIINPLTGDSIQPIVNSCGDTLKTGVPLPLRVEVLDPGIVAQAEVIPAGKPRVVPTHMNVYKIPKNLTVIPVNKDSLKTFTPGTDSSSFVLADSSGVTIPTGVHIPIDGKVVPCIQPQPVKALPPRIKDNASINIRYLDLEHGMNSDFVESFLEDNQGNLWFGTFDEGVIRYNGESFTHFTEQEGLSNNYVMSILQDSQGNLWFGTLGGGVNMYNGETFTHFTEKEGLSNNRVWSILEDSQGNLWFGTIGGGVNMYNGETFTHFTKKEGLSDNEVESILEDSHSNLWFGTYGGGVIRYNGESFAYFTETEGLSDNEILSILEDSRGNLWFGTDGGGVNMYNGETFTHFTQTEGLSDNSVRSMLEDSQGNLWFGTLAGGVNIYNARSFTFFTEQEGLSNNNVRSILEDNQGNFWFGTDGGGVTMYNGETITFFTDKEGLGTSIRTIVEDSHGNLWFGTCGEGVIRYNGETFTHFGKKQGLRNDTIRSIIEDSQGNLWFGTDGGRVSKYNGETFIHFTEKEGSSNYSVWSILEDSRGNLWFGTRWRGVIKYNGETFTHFTTKEGLGNNWVLSILEDSRGNLWFGTHEGVSVFNGKTLTHFTEKQGLSHNSVMSILEDSNGNIWLSTDRGLSQVLFDTDSEKDTLYNPEIYAYGLQDGLKGIDFMANAGLLDSKNRIWWGSYKGLTMLDLNSFKIPVDPPSGMKINWIEINEQFADYRHLEDGTGMKMEFDSVAKFYNYPLNLKLPYRLNRVSFHFSAIDWSAPNKLMYSYKMEGLGDNWSNPSTETNADYRNLPHGTFTFQARAIGAAKKWSEVFEYTFTIRPPWWYSWWAYLIYGFIIVLIILQYRRYLLNRAKLQAAVEIEKMEKEKVEELDHLKSRFFANISHEFRTPLTLLMGPINDLYKNKHRLEAGDTRLLGIMKKNASRLQQLINQLLDLSKLETGKMKLQVREGDLSGFVRTIILSFISLAESKKIDYQHEIPDFPQPVFYDADKIEKILTNLISNAFKFTPQGGKIRVGLTYINSDGPAGPSSAEISVRDTGEGIPREMIDKIFDRFFQVSSSDTREFEGTGIGLSLTKELVIIYRGEIKVESKPGEGSDFKVILPVSRDSFGDDEIAAIQPGKPEMIETGTLEEIESVPGEPEPQEENITEGNKVRPVILIVEDNADLRKYISQHLLKDYQIQEAENGKEGIAKATECIPDLVISDLMMPEMDGMEMCSRLKEDERTSHIPIIMLTAKAEMESKLESLETGADDYILKPFDSNELQVRIKNLIGQRKKLQEQFNRNFFIDDRITELKSADERFLEKAKDIIENHISDPDFNIDSFSQHLGISRMQLYRKLQGLANQSPGEFIQKLRLKHSLILLSKGFDNIAQIAYQVGFSDSSYYARCFRKLYGVSPSEYAKGQNKL